MHSWIEKGMELCHSDRTRRNQLRNNQHSRSPINDFTRRCPASTIQRTRRHIYETTCIGLQHTHVSQYPGSAGLQLRSGTYLIAILGTLQRRTLALCIHLHSNRRSMFRSRSVFLRMCLFVGRRLIRRWSPTLRHQRLKRIHGRLCGFGSRRASFRTFLCGERGAHHLLMEILAWTI